MRRALLLAALAILLPAIAAAAPRTADPDWPCQQALVPTLTAAMMWNGPALDNIGDWHADPAIAALVEHLAQREVTREQGTAALGDFLHGLDGDRQRKIGLVFAGLLDETNRDRTVVIERIKDLAQRQRSLATLISQLTTELEAIPADDQTRAAERTDLQQRWTFTSRSYAELQSTMRYACDVPATLDARLGAYARQLQDALN